MLDAQLPRGHALKLIRESERVFIAYSHSDLKTARLIRQKVCRLRGSRGSGSVFLDQDSMLPGTPVSPAIVDAAILASDLVIVVCGHETARSVEVQREIALTQQQATAALLPVITRPHVVLPAALDYRIQGIFLTVLFPEIRLIRVGAIAATVILTATTVAFAWTSYRDRQARERAVIDTALERDAALRVPSNLDRKVVLQQLLTRAVSVNHRVEALRSLERQVPPATARVSVLPADPARTHLAVAADGRRIVVATSRELSVYALSDNGGAKLVATIDFGRISAPPPPRSTPPGLEEPSWYASQRLQPGRAVPRAPATLKALANDPNRDRILVEVEYATFALMPTKVDAEKAEGSEREVFEVNPITLELQSAGLSVPLKWTTGHDPNGEELGADWYEPSTTDASAWWQRRQTAVVDRARLRPFGVARGQRIEPTMIASDVSTGGALVQIEHYFDPNSEGWRLGSSMRDVFVGVSWPRGGGCRITPKVTVYPGAKALIDGDSGRRISPNDKGVWTSRMPSYTPAALHIGLRRALIRGQLLALTDSCEVQTLPPVDLPWSEVTSAVFTLSGRQLLVTLRDESIVVVGIDTVGERTRFLKPLRAVQIRPVMTGDRVLTLKDDGSVECWFLRFFGADGWAK